jgi:2',3'-cyclic-nucleotide 2'-phosphodiesterase (5'-nucleotidase family)
VAYNTDCTGLVENPEEVLGWLAEDVPLAREYVRHANNALGQLAADAMLHARTSGTPPELGVFNGGAIRDEGVCLTRSRLQAGPLTRGELHEVVLFSNVVSAVDLTGPELLAMFENAVSRLRAFDEPLVLPSGSGRFLHVSEGTELRVDCTRPVGSRVTGLQIGERSVTIPGDDGERYRVAISSFLLGGEDGFTMLTGPGSDPERNPVQAQDFGGTDSRLTAEYLKAQHPTAAEGLRVDGARILFSDAGGALRCAQP